MVHIAETMEGDKVLKQWRVIMMVHIAETMEGDNDIAETMKGDNDGSHSWNSEGW